MKRKQIPKFPKDFFQRNMPIKPLSEAIKDSIPFILNDNSNQCEKKLIKKNQNN